MKVLVAYDGTLQSKEALRYGIEKVRESGGRLVALHVFNSASFIDYDAGLGAEKRARRESLRYLEDAKRIIEESGSGIQADVIMEEGDPEEEVVSYAKTHCIDILLCPQRQKSIVKKVMRTLEEEGKVTGMNTIIDERRKEKLAVVSCN